MSDRFVLMNGRSICPACNVHPSFVGEHRCFGPDSEQRCECQDPLCRLQRREITLAELEAEDAAAFGGGG